MPVGPLAESPRCIGLVVGWLWLTAGAGACVVDISAAYEEKRRVAGTLLGALLRCDMTVEAQLPTLVSPGPLRVVDPF